MLDGGFFNEVGEFEETKSVFDGGFGLADAGADFFRGKVELGLELGVSGGEFDGVQIFTLGVFDDRELEAILSVEGADDGRDFVETSELCGAEAAFASDDLVTLSGADDDDGLENATYLD